MLRPWIANWAGRRHAGLDEMLGDGDEVVEDVLLPLQPPRLVPLGAELSPAPQVGDHEQAAGRQPARPAGPVIGQDRDLETAVAPHQGRLWPGQVRVGRQDQEVRHVRAVGARRGPALDPDRRRDEGAVATAHELLQCGDLAGAEIHPEALGRRRHRRQADEHLVLAGMGIQPDQRAARDVDRPAVAAVHTETDETRLRIDQMGHHEAVAGGDRVNQRMLRLRPAPPATESIRFGGSARDPGSPPGRVRRRDRCAGTACHRRSGPERIPPAARR